MLDARRGGVEGGDDLAGDEPRLGGEAVDDLERALQLARLVDQREDDRDVPAKREQAVAVQRPVVGKPRYPRNTVVPAAPPSRSWCTSSVYRACPPERACSPVYRVSRPNSGSAVVVGVRDGLRSAMCSPSHLHTVTRSIVTMASGSRRRRAAAVVQGLAGRDGHDEQRDVTVAREEAGPPALAVQHAVEAEEHRGAGGATAAQLGDHLEVRRTSGRGGRPGRCQRTRSARPP